MKEVKERQLTAKQTLWIKEYLISLNATDAAKKAGYSEKTADRIGHENLRKLEFEIKEAMAEKESALIAGADEVLKFLTNSMRGELLEEVVVTEGKGDGHSDARIIKKQIGAKDRLKAAELLGKRYVLFTEKINIKSDVKQVIFHGEEELCD